MRILRPPDLIKVSLDLSTRVSVAHGMPDSAGKYNNQHTVMAEQDTEHLAETSEKAAWPTASLTLWDGSASVRV